MSGGSPSWGCPSTSTASARRSTYGTPVLARERRRRHRRVLRLRARGDRLSSASRPTSCPGARTAWRAARRPRLGLRHRLGALRRRRGGRPPRLGHLVDAVGAGEGLATLLRVARGGRAQRPVRHPRPPRPREGLGRRAPRPEATCGASTSWRSRRSPSPASRRVSTAGLRKPVGERYPAARSSQMCLEAGIRSRSPATPTCPSTSASSTSRRSRGSPSRACASCACSSGASGGWSRSDERRTGIGWDVHRLVPGRPLILGGVTIESELGLDGHSDADVLTHAIIDALLGAIGLGDIGEHFPDTEEHWRGADSLDAVAPRRRAAAGQRLRRSSTSTRRSCWSGPKLLDHKPAMRANLAERAGLAADRVNVKATRGEGWASSAADRRRSGARDRDDRAVPFSLLYLLSTFLLPLPPTPPSPPPPPPTPLLLPS